MQTNIREKSDRLLCNSVVLAFVMATEGREIDMVTEILSFLW